MNKIAITSPELAPPVGPFSHRTTIAVAALPLGACVDIDLLVKA